MSTEVLLEEHQALIEASAISPEVADARGYRSISVKAELKRLGFTARQCNVPALLIPVHGVGGGIANYQIRPDEPRIDPRRQKPVKHETVAGSRVALDVPPRVRSSLGDPKIPLFVTEGVRKADSAASQGLCCIDVLGVWNWRGTNERGGSTVLADWESIHLKGRKVYIVFDSDVMQKAEVYKALSRLKGFLEGRGANVLAIYLPPGTTGTKVGLDDFLAAGGTVEDLLPLACSELRQLPGEAEDDLNYVKTEEGMFWRKQTQEGTSLVRLTNFTAQIVGDTVEDDGAEQRRFLEIEARINGRQRSLTLPAKQFTAMSWPLENLGAEAIVEPGFSIRDQARAAVQALSGQVPRRRVLTHTGWTQIEGAAAYVHAGGTIGTVGTVSTVGVARGPGLGSSDAVPEGCQLRPVCPNYSSLHPVGGRELRRGEVHAPCKDRPAEAKRAGKSGPPPYPRHHRQPGRGLVSIPRLRAGGSRVDCHGGRRLVA